MSPKLLVAAARRKSSLALSSRSPQHERKSASAGSSSWADLSEGLESSHSWPFNWVQRMRGCRQWQAGWVALNRAKIAECPVYSPGFVAFQCCVCSLSVLIACKVHIVCRCGHYATIPRPFRWMISLAWTRSRTCGGNRYLAAPDARSAGSKARWIFGSYGQPRRRHIARKGRAGRSPILVGDLQQI